MSHALILLHHRATNVKAYLTVHRIFLTVSPVASQSSLQLNRGVNTSLGTLFSDSLTVFWGDWLDLRVRILQVVASGLISPLIYILAFGLGLGSALTVKPPVGDTYLQFILPGMVALSSMTIS
ncbi:MAG: hypothetical protein LH679_09440, partial [Cyanobacteria bacterium CAN_BIN43]|nr:hypothetical protein [Cyanobacteria bacterium CAN_BIN43]